MRVGSVWRSQVHLLLTAAALTAQDWQLADASFTGDVCYDPLRDRIVRIGEDSSTWEWDGARWLHRHAPGLPPSLAPTYRSPAPTAMVYDTARRRVVALLKEQRMLATYDGTAWTLLPPPADYPQIMAYDARRQRLVLIARSIGTGAETWEHDGAGWQQIQTPTLPPMGLTGIDAPMTFDPLTGRVLVLETGSSSMAVWSYDGVDWTSTSTGTPTNRRQASIGFDPIRRRLVLSGGVDFPFVRLSDVWEWDGASWAQVAAATGQFLAQPTLCFDARAGQLLAFDFAGAARRWDGVAWSAAAPESAPPSSLRVVDPVGGGLLQVSADTTWSWHRGQWTRQSTRQSGIDAVYLGPNGLPHALNLSTQPASWLWAGTWVPLSTPTTVPTARMQGSYALAHDPARNRVVLFGGSAATGEVLGDTWEFDGVDWRRLSFPVSPSARQQAKMIYDPTRTHLLLAGGWGLQDTGGLGMRLRADTWSYDGIRWQPQATMPAPFVGSGALALAYDLTFDPATLRPLALSFRDHDVVTYEHDGTDWQLRSRVTSAAEFTESTARLWTDPVDGALMLDTGAALYRRTVVDRAVAANGTACGSAPQMVARAAPSRGAAGFGLEVLGTPGPVLAAISTTDATVPLGGGCDLRIGSFDVTLVAVAAAGGFADFPLPIPDAPVFVGLRLFAQAAQPDPSSPIGAALSRQLAIAIGS